MAGIDLGNAWAPGVWEEGVWADAVWAGGGGGPDPEPEPAGEEVHGGTLVRVSDRDIDAFESLYRRRGRIRAVASSAYAYGGGLVRNPVPMSVEPVETVPEPIPQQFVSGRMYAMAAAGAATAEAFAGVGDAEMEEVMRLVEFSYRMNE
jgi:hypothetical protein